MAKSKAIKSDDIEGETSPVQFSEAVKAVMEAHPHVHTIFLNENQEWHFQHRPGFEPFTREEVLNG